MRNLGMFIYRMILNFQALGGKYSSAYATSVNIHIYDYVFIHLLLTHVFCQRFY